MAIGSKVHTIYFVPSDGTDGQLDINGALDDALAAMNGWFASETGGFQMRLDTYGDRKVVRPDITFVRGLKTTAEYAGDPDGAFTAVTDELEERGWTASPGVKRYLVYYEGPAESAGMRFTPCAGTVDRNGKYAQCGAGFPPPAPESSADGLGKTLPRIPARPFEEKTGSRIASPEGVFMSSWTIFRIGAPGAHSVRAGVGIGAPGAHSVRAGVGIGAPGARSVRAGVGIRALALAITSTVAVAVNAAGQQPAATSGDLPAVLWSDPGPIASRDLRWGSGSEARAPKGPFTFVEENAGGTQPKIVVTDREGVTWDVKFGAEAHSEVAANRLVWALGYFVEEMYFVPSGKLDKWPALKRGSELIDKSGSFTNARFRRRDPNLVRTDVEWKFDRNPFTDQKELSGLRILMTMINNWDVRGATNNRVLEVTTADGRRERRFIVSDLGATFGRMGGPISNHSKWRLEDFQQEGFIEQVKDGIIHLDYDGWESGMDRVAIEHARWFAALVSQLTEDQIRRAFEAAGAKPEEIEAYSTKIREKISQLQAAVK